MFSSVGKVPQSAGEGARSAAVESLQQPGGLGHGVTERRQNFLAAAGWLLLLGNCFRARRTGDGWNGDRRRGVRGSGADENEGAAPAEG